MQVGLLWFDPDKRRSSQQKLDDAADRYAQRFGRLPNLCHVNPDEVFAHDSIRIQPDPAVLKHHFWVGFDEGAVQSRPRRRRKSA